MYVNMCLFTSVAFTCKLNKISGDFKYNEPKTKSIQIYTLIQTIINGSHVHRPARRHPRITRTIFVVIFSFLEKSQSAPLSRQCQIHSQSIQLKIYMRAICSTHNIHTHAMQLQQFTCTLLSNIQSQSKENNYQSILATIGTKLKGKSKNSNKKIAGAHRARTM